MSAAARIAEPGVYGGVSEADYHADAILAEPSLSCSVAQAIVTRSPAHAAVLHPRLSRFPRQRNSDRFDKGRAVHELLLAGDARRFLVVDEEDWRSKAAKADKARAHAEGLIPLLGHQYEECRLIADVARDQIAEHPDLAGLLDRAEHRECTVVWREEHPAHGFWCRCRPDIYEGGRITDLKVTGTAATPEHWGHRTAWEMLYDFRAAFYRRGWLAATGRDLDYRFVVIEDEPPYALSLFEMTPKAFQVAGEGVRLALDAWGTCLRSRVWPGYEHFPNWLEPPAWVEHRWASLAGRLELVVPRAVRLAADLQRPHGAPPPSLAFTPVDTAAE